jgi:hypothetical protein
MYRPYIWDPYENREMRAGPSMDARPSTIGGRLPRSALVFDDQEAAPLEDAGIIAKGCQDATKPSSSREEP